MEFQPGQTVYRGHMEDHVVVFDEPCDLPTGVEVVVHLRRALEEPRPGSYEAIIRSMGIVDAPPEFDASKITREDLYD